MSLAGWKTFDKEYWGGAWTLPDRASVDMRGALLAQDVRYYNKEVATRYGWGLAAVDVSPGPTGVLGMWDWISEIGNYVIWTNLNKPPNNFYLLHVTSSVLTITTLPWLSGAGVPSYAQAGPRLYVATWDITGTNEAGPTTAGPGVITWDGANFHFDPIIPGPFNTGHIPAGGITEPGVGNMTAGVHSFGFRMLHRSGFLGRPSPDNSNGSNPTVETFIPLSFTSSGSKNLQWAFTPTANWPADVVQVQGVMNLVANPNRWFLVPGATQAVTGGAATPVTLTFNVDDNTLQASGIAEVTSSLDLYTADSLGTASTFLKAMDLKNIGNRMYYVSQQLDASGNAYSVVFASEPYNYQNITLDQHQIQIPNQLKITAVFGVQGAVYLGGPHWVYMTQDNGQTPVNWPTPQIVDGRKGPPTPACVEVATSGQYAWIADKTGLYLFTGSFPTLPVSYLQTEWGQFIFQPDRQFGMVDDPLGHRVIVNPGNHGYMFGWDFTNGMDAFTTRFFTRSKTAGQSIGLFSGGSIAMVQNDLQTGTSVGLKAPELWLGAPALFSSNLYIWREKNPNFDTNIYQDDGPGGTAGINAIYETNILPATWGSIIGPSSVGEDGILAHQAAALRITGAGSLTLRAYTFDRTSFVNLNDNQTGSPFNLSSPAQEGRQLARGYIKSPNGFIYHFEQNAIGSFFDVSQLTAYYTNYASHR